MSTRAQAKAELDHIVQTILDQDPDMPIPKALAEMGVINPFGLITLTNDEVAQLSVTTTDPNTSAVTRTPLNLGQHGLLCAF